jgi:hypothetical protein
MFLKLKNMIRALNASWEYWGIGRPLVATLSTVVGLLVGPLSFWPNFHHHCHSHFARSSICSTNWDSSNHYVLPIKLYSQRIFIIKLKINHKSEQDLMISSIVKIIISIVKLISHDKNDSKINIFPINSFKIMKFPQKNWMHLPQMWTSYLIKIYF